MKSQALGFDITEALGYSLGMKCPHCGKEINVGQMMGSIKSERKAESSRKNGRLGGRRRAVSKGSWKSWWYLVQGRI